MRTKVSILVQTLLIVSVCTPLHIRSSLACLSTTSFPAELQSAPLLSCINNNLDLSLTEPWPLPEPALSMVVFLVLLPVYSASRIQDRAQAGDEQIRL